MIDHLRQIRPNPPAFRIDAVAEDALLAVKHVPAAFSVSEQKLSCRTRAAVAERKKEGQASYAIHEILARQHVAVHI